MAIDGITGSMDRVLTGEGVSLSVEQLSSIGTSVATALNKSTSSTKTAPKRTIYASELGETCPRKVWYRHNTPEVAEPLSPTNKLRFMYGDVVESLALSLVEAGGHSVTHKQQKLVLNIGGWDVVGRIDAIIDGHVVDVKSTTSAGVRKFFDLHKGGNDPYGYLEQLGFYYLACEEQFDDMYGAGFLVVNKTTGDYSYHDYTGFLPDYTALTRRVGWLAHQTHYGNTVAPIVPEPTSYNNTKLSDKCAMCQYKRACFPALKTYQYADGRLVHLVDVKRVPNLQEVV